MSGPEAPVLKSLHWVHICYWVRFKVLIIIYKALNNMDPGYLKDCLISIPT